MARASITAVALLLAACGGPEPRRPAPELAPSERASTETTNASAGPIASLEPGEERACRVVAAPLTDHPLFSARTIGEVAGTTWASALASQPSGGWTTLLVALGREGGLITHDLGMQTVSPLRAETIEGTIIRVLAFDQLGGPARWTAVDVADPDHPRTVSPVAEASGLGVRGWVERFASDGARAIVGMSLGDANNVRSGDAVLLVDVPTGRLVRRWDEPAAAVFCRGTCGFVAGSPDAMELVTVRPGADREERVRLEGGVCAASAWEADDALAVVGLGIDGARGWTVTSGGEVTVLALAHELEPPAACRATSIFPDGSVVVFGRLHRWQHGRVAASPPLATFAPGTEGGGVAVAVGDEVLRVATREAHGMAHSPSDPPEHRRYVNWFRLDGASVERASLVDGAALAPIELPFAPRETQGIADGWSALLLRRGSRVCALLSGGGTTDRAELATIFDACPGS